MSMRTAAQPEFGFECLTRFEAECGGYSSIGDLYVSQC